MMNSNKNIFEGDQRELQDLTIRFVGGSQDLASSDILSEL
jgi:hypothetical protein